MKRLVGILTLAGAMTALAETTPAGLVFTLKKSATEDVLEMQDGEARNYSGMGFHHGSPALRYCIENPTATPRTAQISVKTRSYFRGAMGNLVCLTSVSVGAGEKKDCEVRLPFVDIGNNIYRQVEIDDGVEKKFCGSVSDLAMHTGSNDWYDPKDPLPRYLDSDFEPLVVVSKDVSESRVQMAYTSTWKEEYRKKKRLNNDENVLSPELNIRTCDFSRFTDWRDFSVASAVVIAPTTWTNLTDVTRAALKGYVVAGGSVVLADGNFPKDAPSVGRHGLGEVGKLGALADLVANAARNLQFVDKGVTKPRFPCGAALAAAVEDTLIVAPIPLSRAIDFPADALVSFDGGDAAVHGNAIYIDEQGFHFLDGWTPSLWPVRFRAVRVEGGAQ